MSAPSSHLKIFSSNLVECLLEKLKKNLFNSQGSPWEERLIVVPNASLKSWIQLHLACDSSLGISAGVSICYLDQALNHLSQKFRQPGYYYTPSELELTWLVEKQITLVIEEAFTFSEEQKVIWHPLIAYLTEKNGGKYSLKSLKRLSELSKRLAQLFIEYGRYGCLMLQDWESQSFSTHWQAELWIRIKRKYPHLFLPYQPLMQSLEGLDKPVEMLQVHLFSLSFLPAQAYRFLAQAAQFLPIHYYHFSPCQVFWSDICSDKEKLRMERFWQKKGVSSSQLTALNEVLRERNSFLANVGKMGREMAHQMGECTPQFEEGYLLPAILKDLPLYEGELPPEALFIGPAKPLTLLQAMQADMVILRNPQEGDKQTFPGNDTSIQIHVAYSKQREVEILYNTLLHLLTQHADNNEITPSDIVVLVPDLHAYEPFIDGLFGAPDSLLKHHILEKQSLAKSSLAQAFLSLLSLAEGRWEASDLLQLLDFKEFQKKFNLSAADILQISKWIELSGGTWGHSVAHRQEIIKRDHKSCQGLLDANPAGTWEHSEKRLLFSLAMEPAGINAEYTSDIFPIENLETSLLELLETWLNIINGLKRATKPICEGHLLSLAEWSSYLAQLKDNYLSIELNDREALEYDKNLNDLIEKLASNPLVSMDSFTFASVFPLMKEMIQKEVCASKESDLQAVKFSSLLAMRSLPAKVVALMGLGEGLFPRRDFAFSLNQLKIHSKADYAPTPADFDRYLFLEALLSARCYFIASYVGYSFEDQRDLPPSAVIQELIAYLDASYGIQGRPPSASIIYRHPFENFDQAYFKEGKLFPCYTLEQYHRAQAFYGVRKLPSYQFFKKSHSLPIPSPKDSVINIKELASLASNPLKFYFNKALKMFFTRAKPIKNEESFHLEGLEKYQLRMEGIKKPLHFVLSKANNTGRLPRGLFKTISSEQVSHDIRKMQEAFSLHGVNPQEIKTLLFSENCDKPLMTNNDVWVLPKLNIRLNNQKITIVGRLKEVSEKGLIFHQNKDLKGLVKIWPQYLIFCLAIERFHLPLQAQLISTKETAPFTLNEKDISDLISHFLEYYFASLHSPSPLIPEWVPYFLKEGPASLDKAMRTSLESSFSSFYNDYALWLFREGLEDSMTKHLHQQWSPFATKLFAKLASQIS